MHLMHLNYCQITIVCVCVWVCVRVCVCVCVCVVCVCVCMYDCVYVYVNLYSLRESSDIGMQEKLVTCLEYYQVFNKQGDINL